MSAADANSSLSKKDKVEKRTITIRTPDDMHNHFRDVDDGRLQLIVKMVASQFGRAIVMPNLAPPVVNTKMAVDYRKRLMDALESATDVPEIAKKSFQPLMTLYLTDNTTPEEIDAAVASGVVFACKLYPAGATTNSHSGVTNIFADKVIATIKQMAKHKMPLLVHGEVTDQNIDVFDREAVFIETILKPLLEKVPDVKLVMEHITTKEAAEFVLSAPPNVAATITCHHLLYNRNAIFKGGLQPHMYCLPVLKREEHRKALIAAATSGNPKFFLGTDSAAHEKKEKEKSCGCAGVYTAHAAIELYAEAFDSVGALDKLEAFASIYGAQFYGLKPNEGTITLVEEETAIPASYSLGDSQRVIVPLRANEKVYWKVADRS